MSQTYSSQMPFESGGAAVEQSDVSQKKYDGPTLAAEVAFISCVEANGRVAAKSLRTWNGDTPALYYSASTAFKWGASKAGTAGGTLTYYFDPAANWTAVEKAAFVSGLQMWSAVANVSFQQTTSAASADLTFQRNTDGYSNELTKVQAREPIGSLTLATPIAGSTISIDTASGEYGTLGSFTAHGGFGIEDVLHEEGHFLGLGHAGPYNDTIDPATQQYSAYDNRLYSIMSYLAPTNTSAKYYADNPVTGTDFEGHAPTTWMPLDILAIQRLYGVAVDTPLSGGQVFGYDCNISGPLQRYFDFTHNKTPVVTLWDKGVDNTLNLSGCTTSCTVDLEPGTYSSFDGMTNNLAIAYGTVIDHAVGGSADDWFVGNTLADTIEGGAGDDTFVLSTTPERIDGGDGTDTLIVQSGAAIVLDDANFTSVENVVVAAGGSVDLSGVTRASASIVSQSTTALGVTIEGSRHSDKMQAGTGADTFDEMMASFGRDTISNANLSTDTFEFATSFAADATTAHLHFAAIDRGADTLVYGDAGPHAEALILRGVTAASAEANRGAFHVGGAGA